MVKTHGWGNQPLSRGNGGGNTSSDAALVVTESLPYAFDNMATVPMECDGIPVAVAEALQREDTKSMEFTPEKTPEENPEENPEEKPEEKPKPESQEPHEVHGVCVCGGNAYSCYFSYNKLPRWFPHLL